MIEGRKISDVTSRKHELLCEVEQCRKERLGREAKYESRFSGWVGGICMPVLSQNKIRHEKPYVNACHLANARSVL